MFTIERRVAGLFRAALKRCFNSPATRADQTPVQIRLGDAGLLMHASAPEIIICYANAAQKGKGVFTFPVAHFAEFEGKTDDPVEIALLRPDLAAARWSQRGGNRETQIPLAEPESVAKLPEMPKRFMPMTSHLIRALHDASCSAAQLPTKYVINRVQLRGKSGTIAGTDTTELYLAGGFAFPFKEDLLIPRCGVFGLPPFHSIEDVGLGRTETRLAIRIGPWTFSFHLDKEGRYPDASAIIPKSSHASTRLHLDPLDSERFLNSLTRKLRSSTDDLAVTLDLTEQPCFRYAIEKRVLEVPLAKSIVSGKPVRCCLKLQPLLRTLELRFADFEIRDPNKPIIARDGERLFMVMPLSESSAVLPCPDAVVAPSAEAPTRAIAPVRRPAVKSPIVIPVSETVAAEPNRSFDILGEAEGLRESLIKVADHAGRILSFLREVCTKDSVLNFARTSLNALADQNQKREALR